MFFVVVLMLCASLSLKMETDLNDNKSRSTCDKFFIRRVTMCIHNDIAGKNGKLTCMVPDLFYNCNCLVKYCYSNSCTSIFIYSKAMTETNISTRFF